MLCVHYFLFFFNYTATTYIYTLSLHDALPISYFVGVDGMSMMLVLLTTFLMIITIIGTWNSLSKSIPAFMALLMVIIDRKSTRLNSSHANISYAVFCLKKKKNTYI